MEYQYNNSYDSIINEERPQAKKVAEIVKYWFSQENPPVVVDAGCGPGIYVEELHNVGLYESYGYDKDIRSTKSNIRNVSYCDILNLNHPCNVCLCIEVAEHIESKYSNELIKSLCSNLIQKGILIFSAAHLGQGGIDHVNCRPKEYWQQLIEAEGLLRCTSLETQLITHVKTDIHMGWFVTNAMIFYKI